jgi:hypothetical protein
MQEQDLLCGGDKLANPCKDLSSPKGIKGTGWEGRGVCTPQDLSLTSNDRISAYVNTIGL